jgi:hypothetical protein
MPFEVQTRTETNGLAYHLSFEKALDFAKRDPTIWKISFTLPTGERIRLVRQVGVHGPEEFDFILDQNKSGDA